MNNLKKIYAFAIVAIIISILWIGYNVTKGFLINKQDMLLDIAELEQAKCDINRVSYTVRYELLENLEQ